MGTQKKDAVVPVDIGELSRGLTTMFHGMSEIFSAIGAEENAAEMITGAEESAAEMITEAEENAADQNIESAEKVEDEEPSENLKNQQTVQESSHKSSLTLVDLQKIAGTKILADRANQEKIQKIITSFGVSRLGELPESEYEAFMTQLTTL